MITYAERACFDPAHLELLARVQAYIERVSDRWGNELRCHELARAVADVLAHRDLIVVDGKCGPIEHSWLCFSDGKILDPYVPGRVPAVQLVDPIAGSYRPGNKRRDIKQAIVDQLIREMRKTPTRRTPDTKPASPRVLSPRAERAARLALRPRRRGPTACL